MYIRNIFASGKGVVDSTDGILIGDFQAIAPANNEVKENFINITYHFFFEADNKVFNIFAGCSTYWKKKKKKNTRLQIIQFAAIYFF